MAFGLCIHVDAAIIEMLLRLPARTPVCFLLRLAF